MSLDILKMTLEKFWDQIKDMEQNPPSDMYKAGAILGAYTYYIHRQHEYICRLEAIATEITDEGRL